MRIRLLGKDRTFASPDRSVYSLKRDQSGNSFTLIVPIDVWLLQRNSGSDFGILRSPLAGWSEAELAMSQSPQGFSRLIGNQPNFTTGGFSSLVRGMTKPGFRVLSDSQEELAERVSKLDIFPRSEVAPGLAVGIQQTKGIVSPRGKVSHVDETFIYEFLSPLAMTVPRLNVFQVDVPNRLQSQMIGSPVIARRPEEPPKRLGMLVGFINQSDGRSKAFVLPAETLE